MLSTHSVMNSQVFMHWGRADGHGAVSTGPAGVVEEAATGAEVKDVMSTVETVEVVSKCVVPAEM